MIKMISGILITLFFLVGASVGIANQHFVHNADASTNHNDAATLTHADKAKL